MTEEFVSTEESLEEFLDRDQRLGDKGRESFQLLWRQKEKNLRENWGREPANFRTNVIQIPKRPITMFLHFVLNRLVRVAGDDEEIMIGLVLRGLLNRFSGLCRAPPLVPVALEYPYFPPL